MSENEFYMVQNKFEMALQALIEACVENYVDIDEMLTDILLEYDIEL